MSHPDQTLIADALARRPAACRTLVDRLSPAIQRQVNGALIRRGRARREEVRDHVQEIFRILLDDDGKILRAWDPDKGASLEGYVGMVAERRVASILSSGRKSAHAEDPTAPEDFDQAEEAAPNPELTTMSRQLLARVLDELRQRLTDQGYLMFRLLYLEQREVPWIMETYELKRDAVYGWRARIKKTIREISEDLGSDPDPPSGRVEQGGRT